MAETATERDILLITADAVKDTGVVSFKFMIDADPDRKLRPMPRMFGFISCDRDGSHVINVFEGGKGLVVGGGWAEDDRPEWAKELLDSLPSCALLMNIDSLPWWTELCKQHGVKFRHHHFQGILKTN